MALVTDAMPDPTNVTYNGVVDGVSTHAGATVAIGKKYIATDGNFPGASGNLTAQSLALCISTSPETWVALFPGKPVTVADSSTGLTWSYVPTSNGWVALLASLSRQRRRTGC